MSQSRKEPPLTYCAMSDELRAAYKPLVPLPSQFEKCFEPLRITDAEGGLTEELLKGREKPVTVALAG